MAPLGACNCFAPDGWVWLDCFFDRYECLKGQDSDMEHAEKHKKSEKDLKSGHSAGKGRGKEGKWNGKRIKNQFSCLLAMLFPLQNNWKFASAIKLLCRKIQRSVVPGIQEHENRAQLSPGKGYLIENESE